MGQSREGVGGEGGMICRSANFFHGSGHEDPKEHQAVIQVTRLPEFER